jgi:hypothetical protein
VILGSRERVGILADQIPEAHLEGLGRTASQDAEPSSPSMGRRRLKTSVSRITPLLPLSGSPVGAEKQALTGESEGSRLPTSGSERAKRHRPGPHTLTAMQRVHCHVCQLATPSFRAKGIFQLPPVPRASSTIPSLNLSVCVSARSPISGRRSRVNGRQAGRNVVGFLSAPASQCAPATHRALTSSSVCAKTLFRSSISS